MIRPALDWQPLPASNAYTDICYDLAEGIARIVINRPERRNAFRPETIQQLIDAMHRAQFDPGIGVIILTGAGHQAFCSGGDQIVRGDDGGYHDESGMPHLNVLDLQMQIRRCPKPVVAMVAGYAIGGGHVLHLVCDLSIAADNARFGQTGPRVGSFDAGLGAGLMARTIGLKPTVRCNDSLVDGTGQCRRATCRTGGGNGALVSRDAAALANGTAHDQGRLQRRHRRPGRHSGTRR